MSYMDDLLAHEKRVAERDGKKRMKSFQITELSIVDDPAQEGAVPTITKRRDDTAAERAAAALARQTDRLAEKITENASREATAASLRLAEEGERMMEEEDDPNRQELEAKRERGRQRFMATRGQTMTTKATFKNLAREGKQAQLADNFRKTLNACETRQDMQKAIDDDPEGYSAFQQWGDDTERGPDPDGDAVEKTVSKRLELDRKVAKAVDDVRERDGCDGRTAMQKARDENPELFDEWNSHCGAL